MVKNLPANEGDIRDKGSIPRSERSPGGSGGLRPLVELCVEPAGLCGRCTGVAVPLRVVPSPTGSGASVHGILQARILQWVTVPYSRESSQPRV